MQIIDPRNVSKEDLPRIIFVQDLYSWFGFGIRLFSKGVYNHAMIQYDPEYVASQNFLFHGQHIEDYMQPHIKMKFFGFAKATPSQKEACIEKIKMDLALPWYKRTYDVPGIIGHIFRMPETFQLPSRNYCTESTSNYIDFFGYESPAHPSVKELNRWCVDRPEDFSREGYYVQE